MALTIALGIVLVLVGLFKDGVRVIRNFLALGFILYISYKVLSWLIGFMAIPSLTILGFVNIVLVVIILRMIFGED